MGREIRRVPPNWQHPRWTDDDAPRLDKVGRYRPCHDQEFASAAKAWKEGYAQWERGQHSCQHHHEHLEYWEYDVPPTRDKYRPAFDEEPTWYQVYETVSEGTPVTPPFPTKETLYQHLITVGDDWSVRRNDGPYSPKAARAFVYGSGFAPSAVMIDGQFLSGIEACATLTADENDA